MQQDCCQCGAEIPTGQKRSDQLTCQSDCLSNGLEDSGDGLEETRRLSIAPDEARRVSVVEKESLQTANFGFRLRLAD